MPPRIGPRTAVLASRALITGWKTSCCGIEPIIIVIAAEIQKSQPLRLMSGQGLKRSREAAKVTTCPKPPAMPLAQTATAMRPATMMIIWKKSVTATDHMPPYTV